MLREEPGLLPVPGEEVTREVEDLGLAGGLGRDLDAHRRQLEEDGAGRGVTVGKPDGAVWPEAYSMLEVHHATFHANGGPSTRDYHLTDRQLSPPSIFRYSDMSSSTRS